jgi:hypothetical protein
MFADTQVGLNVQRSFFDTVMTIGITRTLLFLKQVSHTHIPEDFCLVRLPYISSGRARRTK